MEVHHYPQISEKKIKEYPLEGLMIFIAVTLGFFAESLRETLSDNEHARQLTGQLEKDLIKDTLEVINALITTLTNHNMTQIDTETISFGK